MIASAIVSARKKPGPAPTGKGTLVGIRLQPDILNAVDEMVAFEAGEVTRPEMIRRILREWLIENRLIEGSKP